MKIQIYMLGLFFSLLFQIDSIAQEKKNEEQKDYQNSTLFNSVKPIDLQLYIDKKDLLRDVGDDRKYHPALVRLLDTEKEHTDYAIKLKTRGNFRRNPDNCNMAPLRFKIPKKIRRGENIFAGQHKLKFVLPCRQNNERFQEYVIQEYLIYKIYNLLSDTSYRVRLANIELVDSLEKDKSLKFTGFFLEETDQMASRLNGKVLNFKRFHPANVNKQQMTMMVVFQYLVGNTDWSVDVGHNIKLLFVNNQNVPFAIPYDFDWSGIVNAAYAKPAEQLNITTVRERTFRGYKRSMEEFEPVVKLFNEKKEEIYNLYRNCELLSEKSREKTIKYIDEFYEIINDQKKIEKEFIKNSRKN